MADLPLVIDGGEYKMLTAARMNIHLSAAGIIPATTNGCGTPAASETSTNAVNWMGAEFADDADSHGWWGFGAPENWDGSVKIEKVCWSCSAGSAGDTVEWEIAAVGGGDGGDIDAALGTAVSLSDTVIGTGKRHICGAGSTLTPAGSPAAGEEILIRITRDVSAGTLAQPVQLHWVLLSFGLSGASA